MMMARAFAWLRVGGLLVGILLTAACTNSNIVTPDETPPSGQTAMWRATVLVETGSGHGSGVIVGARSVLTAFHVVEDGTPEIEFFGGERVRGAVTWSSEALDLAVVRVGVPERYGAPALFCGELTTEQPLVAIGHPLSARWVLVEGYLDSRDITDRTHLLPLGFDLSLGNSGGPVFDGSGRIVGIAEAILVSRSVRETATEAGKAEQDFTTGTGLMLPARLFCDEIGEL